MKTIKLISWNVNGIRAALRKGFKEFVDQADPDMICLQETKAHQHQVEVDLSDYTEYWNSAEKKGYSGTAIFTKTIPESIQLGMQIDYDPELMIDSEGRDVSTEGRVLTAEYNDFYLVTVYTPNSKRELTRLNFRHTVWDPLFLKYVQSLDEKKPVIFCGDLNVAHTPIDLARPETNEGEHGYTKEEREGFDNILAGGFVDTFRMFTKEGGHYTWWTPWRNARQKKRRLAHRLFLRIRET
ncbi:MAG: Exodeoxyribonuclease [candidate division WS6 bacterium OLB20]|uniref:Exodeoxyribonuclease n=1 Tax=candidate division WS6 bacterium OLB20 TaxID=1617426 RepID=A0A136M0G2_9BACT|nr:MAG: Exodeoxyribonuclease [candidate division WS6 bacterium OLB20]